MKFNINGKLLKDIVNIVTLRVNIIKALVARSKSCPIRFLCSAEENMVYFYNGNPGTFVVYRYETEAEPGSVCCVQTNVFELYCK